MDGQRATDVRTFAGDSDGLHIIFDLRRIVVNDDLRVRLLLNNHMATREDTRMRETTEPPGPIILLQS